MKVKFNTDYDWHPYAQSNDGVEIEVTERWLRGYERAVRIFDKYQDQIGTMIVAAKAEFRRKKKIDEVYQP